jgi:predicted double-glycine peptidase
MDEKKFQELVIAQFEKMNQRFDSLENQVKENTQVLKALEHVAEVNKSEHDRMFGEIRDIKSNIVTLVDESIKNYLGRKTFRLIVVNE